MRRHWPNFLLLVSAGIALYGAHAVWSDSGMRFDLWTAILGALILAAILFLGMMVSRFAGKENASLAVMFTLLGAFLGNWVLEGSGYGLIEIIEAKAVQRIQGGGARTVVLPVAPGDPLPDFVSPRPPDARTFNEIRDALAAVGIAATRMYNPPPLAPFIDNGLLADFLPLSSRSMAITVLCNEGDQREFPIIRTDRYGFNNDDTVHARTTGKVLIVGDSFAQGSCVHQEENVAGLLRRGGYPTMSAGIGGFGPLYALASIAEYGAPLEPETVLWFYFDGNDITDLPEKDLRSRLLLQYLRDDFTQGLITRQAEIDAFWDQGSWTAAEQRFKSETALQEAWDARLTENLSLVQERLGDDIESLTEDSDLIRIFQRVLGIAKRRVEAWGGRLIFVMIPNKDDYHGRIPIYRLPVLNAVRELGLPIIDADEAIRRHGDPLQFYPVRNDWGHFNPKGYALLARQIIAELEGDAVLAALPEATGKSVAEEAVAAAEPQPTVSAYLPYESHTAITRVLSPEPELTTREDGHSILGYGFTTISESSILAFDISVNAFSAQENTLVVAVFLIGIDEPLKMFAADIAPGERIFLERSFELPAFGRRHLGFDIRVGPAHAGELFINGDDRNPVVLEKPAYLRIRDLGAAAGEQPDQDARTFQGDDGTEAYARLAGIYMVGGEAEYDMTPRQEVDCESVMGAAGAATILTFGQSQSSNSGEERYASRHDVFNLNIFDMRCYRAADPLLGTTNSGGSIWSRLGDKLIEGGVYEAVTFIPIGVGGTYLEEWMPGGKKHDRLLLALRRLHDAGIEVDAMLWHQGEAEAGLQDFPGDSYKSGFLEVVDSIREEGFDAPIYIAQSTICGSDPAVNGSVIRQAQRELAAEHPDLRAGPDTDSIGIEQRFDQCHFSDVGLANAARLWAATIFDTRPQDTPTNDRAVP